MHSTPTYISTAATTTIVTGTGKLDNIVIAGGTLGNITVYDNTAGSGTIIAKFDSSASRQTYLFGSSFGKGLTIVTSAATQLTVNTSP